MRYWFSIAPLAIVIGTLALVFSPILVLTAMVIVSLAALVAIAWAIVAIPRAVGHSISRRWAQQSQTGRAATALTTLIERETT